MNRLPVAMTIAALLVLSQASGKNSFIVKNRVMQLELSRKGEIVSIGKPDGSWKKMLGGHTFLDSCAPEQGVQVKHLRDNGIEFTRTFMSLDQQYRCTVIDRFVPDSASIRWEVSIEGSEHAWSTGIATSVRFSDAAGARFWTTWGDPNHLNPADWGGDPGVWHNPFEFRPLRDMHLVYGSRFEKGAGYSVPVFSVIYPDEKTGICLAMSPEDTLLDLHLVSTRDGEVTQTRKFNRLEHGSQVTFTMHLLIHDDDWRSVLAFMVGTYPRFFYPAATNALAVCGLGAYSSYEGDIDAAKYRKMGGIVNWKASFDFSYMGMFIPPVATDTTRWQRFDVSSGGALIAGKKTYTTIKQMRDYATRMKALGFSMLNYFNATEFGGISEFADSVVFPRPSFTPATNVWKNPSAFLYSNFPDAILFGSLDLGATAAQYMRLPVSFHNQPYWTWGRAIVTDVGDSSYARFLLNQAQLHVDKFPDAQGLCMDRLDWFSEYNWHANDGKTWVEGRPVRAMLNSYKAFMPRLGKILHDNGKVLFCNPLMNRLDMMAPIDGVFNEFGYIGHNLNQSAFLTLFKPLLSWTLDSATVLKSPDRYFQSHILMGAFPSAPFPGNDHCIGPNPQVERYYLDYGPMFTRLHGRKWVLLPHVVEVRSESALCNLFAVGQKLVLPIVLGGADSTRVKIRYCHELLHSEAVSVEAFYPGQDKPDIFDARATLDELSFTVPLRRGCAFLTLSPQ